MGRLTWSWICLAWVWVPIVAWLPGVPQRLAMPWWFGISSLVVIAVGLSQPVQRQVRWTGWWLAGCLAVFWIHQTQFGMSSKWLMAMLTALVATHLVSERGEWSWIRRAVLWVAWLQVPICLVQAVNIHTPYLTLGQAPWGSLGNRIDLSLLWGAASVVSVGWRAWVWAGLSCLTGSLTGSVPAVGWLVWQRLPRTKIRWLALALSLIGLWWIATPHLLTRWEVWRSIGSWQVPWVSGLGFLSFPGGFTYDDAVSKLIGMRDTHSVWLDWLLRTGVLGAVLLAGAGIWIWRRTRVHRAYGFLVLAFWAGTWQSLEARPLMALLAWWWVVCLQEDSHGCVAEG